MNTDKNTTPPPRPQQIAPTYCPKLASKNHQSIMMSDNNDADAGFEPAHDDHELARISICGDHDQVGDVLMHHHHPDPIQQVQVHGQVQEQDNDTDNDNDSNDSNDSNDTTEWTESIDREDEQETPPDADRLTHSDTTLANNNNDNDNINAEVIIQTDASDLDFYNDMADSNLNSPSVQPPSPSNRGMKQDQWSIMLDRLIAYKAENNHTAVSKRYPSDPKLGTWVETQRVQFKKMWIASGQSEELLASAPDPSIYVMPNTRLNADRLQRLQEVGFAWSVRKSRSNTGKRKQDQGASDSHDNKKQRRNDVQWNEMYQRLIQYKNEHGDCIVPKGYPSDPKLACWIETQRHLHSKYYSRSDVMEDGGVQSGTQVLVDGYHDNANINAIGIGGVHANGHPISEVADMAKEATHIHDQPLLYATAVPDAGTGTMQNDFHVDGRQSLDTHTTEAVVAAIQNAVTAATAAATATATECTEVAQEMAIVADLGLGIVIPGNGVGFSPDRFAHRHQDIGAAAEGNGNAVANNGEDDAGETRNIRLTKERKDKLDALEFVSVWW